MSISQHQNAFGVFNRRNALQLTGAGAVLGAASFAGGPTVAHADETSSTTLPSLVDQFLAQPQFVIAHRGAGDVNPEHTAYAYQQAILKGAKAVEISVRQTRDGELVCMHDNALRRTTTQQFGAVNTSTLADLSTVQVDMRSYLGSGTPLQKISTLAEALDTIATTPAGGAYSSVGSNAILFIEAKDIGFKQLLPILTERGLMNQVVIKMYRNGSGGFDPETGFVKVAKEAGFKTWCYFDATDPMSGITALANSPYVDLLGVPFFETVVDRVYTSMSDAQIASITALGKPVIAWEVHRRSVRDRLAALGVRGFMSPNPYWLEDGAGSPDLFLSEGRRLHGMLPAGQQDVANMPSWENNSLVHSQMYDESMLLGPLSHRVATSGGSWVMYFDLKWSGYLPTTDWQYGYMAFGREDDSPFGIQAKFDTTNPKGGGYVLAVRPQNTVLDEAGRWRQGDFIQLLKVTPGTTTLTPLATISPKTPIKPDQNITCKLIVRPDSIVFEGGGTRSQPVYDATYRGNFIHFGRYHGNSMGGPLALSNVVTYKI